MAQCLKITQKVSFRKKNRGCEATELHTSVDQRNSSRFGLLKNGNETFFYIFRHCGSVWLLFALISHFLPCSLSCIPVLEADSFVSRIKFFNRD